MKKVKKLHYQIVLAFGEYVLISIYQRKQSSGQEPKEYGCRQGSVLVPIS